MSDLDAIREDVALAARSAEMARHVALDHAPELLDEVERLRAERDQAKRDWLTMDDAWTDLLRKVSDAAGLVDPERDLSEDEVVAAVAALARRRVETAEELDALPEGAVVRDAFGRIAELTEDGDALSPGTEIPGLTHHLYLPATVLWLREVSS